jgi:hypothetical protein
MSGEFNRMSGVQDRCQSSHNSHFFPLCGGPITHPCSSLEPCWVYHARSSLEVDLHLEFRICWGTHVLRDRPSDTGLGGGHDFRGTDEGSDGEVTDGESWGQSRLQSLRIRGGGSMTYDEAIQVLRFAASRLQSFDVQLSGRVGQAIEILIGGNTPLEEDDE